MQKVNVGTEHLGVPSSETKPTPESEADLSTRIPFPFPLLEYKKRNNTRRDEDRPELREAVDDIYRLLGYIEVQAKEIQHQDSYWDDPLRGTNKC